MCVGEFLVSMQFSAKKKKKKKKNTDPNQTLYSVTSDLSLHGLSKYTLWNINSADDDILKYVSFFFFRKRVLTVHENCLHYCFLEK